jgi:hypothetical protein
MITETQAIGLRIAALEKELRSYGDKTLIGWMKGLFRRKKFPIRGLVKS